MRITSLVLAAFFVMSSALFSVGGETLKVGAIFAKTGKTFISKKIPHDGVKFTPFDGIRFAVQEINKNGGLLGKQLVLLEFSFPGSSSDFAEGWYSHDYFSFYQSESDPCQGLHI